MRNLAGGAARRGLMVAGRGGGGSGLERAGVGAGGGGLEPPTYGSKGRRSAVELPAIEVAAQGYPLCGARIDSYRRCRPR